MRRHRLLLALGCICLVTVCAAEPADDFLERYAATYRFRLGRPTEIQVTPDGGAVLFLRSGSRDFAQDLYELDLAEGSERMLLDADRLLGGQPEQLTAEEQARRERQRLVARGITSYELSNDGRRMLVPLAGRLFVVERSNGAIRELGAAGGRPIDPQLSPDGTRVACVRDGDLFVIDVATGTERRLTTGASDTVTHGLAEFVAQEEMGRHHGFWWSPDSRRIVYQRTDTTAVERLSIVDPVRPEEPAERWPYPRAGRANADVTLGIVSVEGGPTTWIDWDREHFEYLANVSWTAGAPLTLLVQDRRQTEQQLLTVNVEDGRTKSLWTERDAAWVEIPDRAPLWLPDGSGWLWITERHGARELELRGPDGSLVRGLTGPELGLQRLAHLDWAGRAIVVEASSDPTETHLYRVRLDARVAPERLTSAPGIHEAIGPPVATRFVVESTPLDGASRWLVYGSEGPAGRELRSVAEAPPFEPRVEFVTVDGPPLMHAALVRPRDFAPGQRYPVIVHVYGGPTAQMVRKSPSGYLLDQWMADHGFIVVRLDGRGTPNRGRDWERAVKGDLIRLPLEDQAAGVRALGRRFAELDLERVGVYGWSFGGYFSAMAVLQRPDVFRVAVAGAPVTDWADYDTHYTERYMGLPQENAEGYAAASALTYADRLTRPLLLIHGTADDNVYFMHSLKLADALFRSGKPFEFLPLTGFTHMVPDPLVTTRLYRRVMAEFEAHLRR